MGENTVGIRAFAYLPDISFGKARVPIPLSPEDQVRMESGPVAITRHSLSLVTSCTNCMANVLSMRDVFEVVGSWIQLIGILMVDFLPLGTRAKKRSSNQDMGSVPFSPTGSLETIHGVSQATADIVLEDSPWRVCFPRGGSVTPNSADVGNRIPTVPTDNRLPDFGGRISDGHGHLRCDLAKSRSERATASTARSVKVS